MAKVDKHIKDLLLENECVIVPQMGGIINLSPAVGANSYKLSSGPETLKLTFNTLLNYNDGLLVNHIIKKEKISYEEAIGAINRFVEEFRRELESGKKFAIEEIGEFYRDSGNVIRFKPVGDVLTIAEAGSLTKSLSSIVTEDESESTKVNPLSLIRNKLSANDKNAPVNKKRKVFISFFSAFTVIMFICCLYIYFSKDKAPVLKERASAVKSEFSEVKKDEDISTTPELTSVIQRGIDGRSPVTEENRFVPTTEPQLIPEKAVVERAGFFIVAGSFRSQDNAVKKLDDLKKSGYANAQMISEKGRPYFVCFGAYNSRKDAEDVLRGIKQRGEEGWIYSR